MEDLFIFDLCMLYNLVFFLIELSSQSSSPWHWWNELVTLAGPAVSESLFLVLEVTLDLPEEGVISRWISEPVAALALSTNLFISNSKGFPILSRPHQTILRRFLKVPLPFLVLIL